MSTATRLDPPPTAAEWAAEVAADDQARARLASAARTTTEQHEAARDTSVVRSRDERYAAIVAKREQAAATARAAELAARNAVPSSGSDVDADPEVADLERRVVEGDQTVTAEQLEAARTGAARRGRFGRLRDAARARKDAEAEERRLVEQRKAAEDAARAALAPYSAEQLAEVYDAAVRAIGDLRAYLQGYNGMVIRLATGPEEQRPPRAASGRAVPGGAHVEVDGQGYNPIVVDTVLEGAVRGHGLGELRGTVA